MGLVVELPKLAKLISYALALVLLSWLAPPGLAYTDKAHPVSGPHTTGLMWNRTGLPAVFPLQVKSQLGRDYFLTLINNETGEDALAAYIEGGSFFKVLVPPGEFRVSFAAGLVWRGEEELFGSGTLTHVFELENPLTFEIRNPGIKAGHIVDLSPMSLDQLAQADTKEQLICQTFRWEYLSLPTGHEIGLEFTNPEDQRRIRSWYGQLRFPIRRTTGVLQRHTHLDYRYPRPHRAIRSRFCG